jgi:hypothetical protein
MQGVHNRNALGGACGNGAREEECRSDESSHHVTFSPDYVFGSPLVCSKAIFGKTKSRIRGRSAAHFAYVGVLPPMTVNQCGMLTLPTGLVIGFLNHRLLNSAAASSRA